jgi:hypothetical protein
MDREAPMSDSPRVNHTSHCDMCSPGMRNQRRTHIGDDHDPGPRIAVCAYHDTAGPPELLPTSLRFARRQWHDTLAAEGGPS